MGIARMHIDGRLNGQELLLPYGYELVAVLPSNGGQEAIIRGPELPKAGVDGKYRLFRPITRASLDTSNASVIVGFTEVT